MPAATMDFFTYQDQARRKTSLLIGYYVLAVVMIVVAVYLVVAATFAAAKSGQDGKTDWSGLWNPGLLLGVAAGTLLVVAAGSAYKISRLSSGGEAVATMLGGRPVNRNTRDPNERKLLNVVEEMAIASGTPVPRVFILDDEEGINAFAAGFAMSDAVVAATRGCVEHLTRDELQGVIAHEFSHIFNGDMRLNIRLMGVLNGILVIGIIGYYVFRSALYSNRGRSRSSSKDKGNTLPLVLFGLAIMAIGYIGVFFGKLIKSAVSRQREFLADASAVQFTRNPAGIVGALKKIGGYTKSSRLRTHKAEEASHFFFANGLSGGLAGLLATHPPLADRIKRFDAAFDAEPGQPLPADSGADTRAAGFAGSTPSAGRPGAERIALKSDDVIARVGAPMPEHIDYAAGVIAALPGAVSEAAREPFGARALVYCLLLNREPGPRGKQIGRLSRHADPEVYRETRSLMPAVDGLSPECRLPLADLCVSALKELSGNQYAAFRENVRQLIEADDAVDLFEYTIQRMLLRHLEPVFGRTVKAPVRYHSVKPLLVDCAGLLSCLAYWGAEEQGAAESAFRKGARKLGAGDEMAMLPADRAGLKTLDTALARIVRAAPQVKRGILDACVTCVADDGYVTVEEAELLRAVADSMDCPIPPFVPGRRV